MKYILTLAFAILSLSVFATGLDSSESVMFNKPTTKEINLNLSKNNTQLSSSGSILTFVGFALITSGVLLENKRIETNQPDGVHGYSKSNEVAFNYSLITIGSGISITGIVMIIKSFK